jgi:hypothetical protein
MGETTMKRAVLYLRVSTLDQTTANQERELRQAAERAGWQVTKVYKDHGISGAKGRDERPAFDALQRAATRREFDVVMAWNVDRLGRSLQESCCLPVRATCTQGGFVSAPTRLGHNHASWKGHVSDAWRLCRIRALNHSGTGTRWPSAGQERGKNARKDRLLDAGVVRRSIAHGLQQLPPNILHGASLLEVDFVAAVGVVFHESTDFCDSFFSAVEC